MDKKRLKKFLASLVIFYWAFVILIHLVAREQFHQISVTSNALSPTAIVGELSEGTLVQQRLIAPAEVITSIDIIAAKFGDSNNGLLNLSLMNADNEEVARGSIEVFRLSDGQYTNIPLEQRKKVSNDEPLTLNLSFQGISEERPVSIYYGNMVTAGRFDIAVNIPKEDMYVINGKVGLGQLCIRLNAIKTIGFYRTYWMIVIAIFLLLTLYAIHGYKLAQNGVNSGFAAFCTLFTKYAFLLSQLISRDFKIKYKRSVLGMTWSLLNPLLTMTVQYIVFSTLFKSNIPNYPVYLLSGIVFFNFFTEVTTLGMTSITSNASLIKKVYMPKYVYPIARVCSSFINFMLAIIPLFLVMLFTGTPFKPSLVLLLFVVLCLLGFVTGMVLLLSTAMTFFQDTQFLWGVMSMIWMYMTPLFYPENIIPVKFLTIYHMNPMYQYITFARICIINGVSPEPMSYIWCIISSLVVLLIGVIVFKREQDKFVLHL